jgi:hypothetical protein
MQLSSKSLSGKPDAINSELVKSVLDDCGVVYQITD